MSKFHEMPTTTVEQIVRFRKAALDEIDRLRAAYEDAEDSNTQLRNESYAISLALNTTEYMDPPDGGSPSIAEQVSRMRTEVLSLRAENTSYKKGNANRPWASSRP